MPDQTLREHAGAIMCDAARDVHRHTIQEHLEDQAGERVDPMTIQDIADLISKASITIDWPDQPSETARLREQLDRANTERQTLAAELAGALDERDHATAATRQLQADLDATAHAADRARADLATMTKIAQGYKRHVADLTAILERVQALTLNTDGDPLDPDVEIPIGEFQRVLNEPIPDGSPFCDRCGHRLSKALDGPECGNPQCPVVVARRAQEPSPTHVWSEQRKDWMPLAGPVSPGGCEKCERPIQPGEPFVPPLPGVGLVEHVQCPPARPAVEQLVAEARLIDAVVDAAIAWRNGSDVQQIGVDEDGEALIAAVDRLLASEAQKPAPTPAAGGVVGKPVDLVDAPPPDLWAGIRQRVVDDSTPKTAPGPKPPSTRFSAAAGGPANLVSFRSGSGRQYTGERSDRCPGDGYAGHRHDVRCIRPPALPR